MDSLFIAKDGKKLGPYNFEQARFLLSQGFLSSEDLAWAPGFVSWVALSSVLTTSLVGTGAPNILVPSAPSHVPTIIMPTVVKPPVRGIRFWDIAWCIIGIIVLWNFGLQSIVVPVATVAGLILAYYGCASIPPLRRAFYALVPASNATESEVGYTVVAFGLALLSLTLWLPLFTFSSWIFWSEVSLGPVLLWFANSCLFGYGFLMTRRLSRAAAEVSSS